MQVVRWSPHFHLNKNCTALHAVLFILPSITGIFKSFTSIEIDRALVIVYNFHQCIFLLIEKLVSFFPTILL